MWADVLVAMFMLLGSAAWLTEYRLQRRVERRFLIVRPPRLLARLCGDPMRDGTVELDCAIRQWASLAFIVGAPLARLTGLAPHLWAGGVFVAHVAVALPGQILVERARRRAQRERNMLSPTGATGPFELS